MAYTFLTKEFSIDRFMGNAGKGRMLNWIYICAVGYVINTKKMTTRDVKVKKKIPLRGLRWNIQVAINLKLWPAD